MLLALSPVLIDRITALGVPPGNPSAVAYLILVLGFFGWPFFARIIRGQVLSLREREFIEAAKSLGAKRRGSTSRSCCRNLWAPILVYTTLILPTNISAEAALSFLGVGIKAADADPRQHPHRLGELPAAGPDCTSSCPGLFIFAFVLAFNLLGDGLRDALDPKADRT